MILEIKRTILEKEAEAYPMAQRAVRRLQGWIPVSRDDGAYPATSEEFQLNKDTMRLMAFPGELFKPCPGTREYLCCGYQILNIGTNCPLDCSYCILQAYFNQPCLRVFVNLEQHLESIGESLRTSEGKIFRIGTGEFTDSLALDPIVKWTEVLPSFIAKHRNALLEFKTKTTFVEGLLSSPFRDRIVVSWSLNSTTVAAREEHGAPSIRKRLEAARECQREGYILGFHFDPLIENPLWQREYAETLELLDRYIDPKGVIWISLGCLRYMPSLKKVIRRRFPRTHILDGEFVPGLDGKMRYIKPLRIEMYAFMKQQLDAWHKDLGLYLCMESDEIWQRAMGWSPGDSKGLSRYLDMRAMKFFPELKQDQGGLHSP